MSGCHLCEGSEHSCNVVSGRPWIQPHADTKGECVRAGTSETVGKNGIKSQVYFGVKNFKFIFSFFHNTYMYFYDLLENPYMYGFQKLLEQNKLIF